MNRRLQKTMADEGQSDVFIVLTNDPLEYFNTAVFGNA